MDCRTFRRNLEDYLEDGLDFAGRFGVERHARQCIGCGKNLADAQRIRRMVSELERVKAPENFEASVVNEIGRRKLDLRASGIRRFWNYGLDLPLWQKLALASACVVVLAMGASAARYLALPGQNADSYPAIEKTAESPADAGAVQNTDAGAVVPPTMERVGSEELSKIAAAPKEPGNSEQESVPDWNAPQEEFMEHLTVGMDGRPVTIQLPMPRKIHVRYNQMSEDYFIQNVSH